MSASDEPELHAEMGPDDGTGIRFRDAYVTLTRTELLVNAFVDPARLPLTELRSLLSAHGLHIVDAKDRAVLEAMSAAVIEPACNLTCCRRFKQPEPLIVAELARREKT